MKLKRRQKVEGTVHRELTITGASFIDKDKRILELSFSSEAPVVRRSWWEEPWVEILGHNPGECDLSRLNSTAPLLYNHNRTREDRIGAVLSAAIQQQRGVAQVQVSSRPDVDDIWTDIAALLLRNVSVSYSILERILINSNGQDGLPEYRVISWQPTEISFVDIPADYSVGVGRDGAQSSPHVLFRAIDLEDGPDESEEQPSDSDPINVHQEIIAMRTNRSAISAFFGGLLAAGITAARNRADYLRDAAKESGISEAELNLLIDGKRDIAGTAEIRNLSKGFKVSEDSILDAASRAGDAPALPVPAGSPASDEQSRAAEFTRSKEIRGLFREFGPKIGKDKADTIMHECLDDQTVTVDGARTKFMTALGGGTQAGGGDPILRGENDSELDKFGKGVEAALMVRGKMLDKPEQKEEKRKAEAENHFRGYSMIDMARDYLRLRGESYRGMDKMALVGRAFLVGGRAQTTSDFTNILMNVANKSVLMGYQEAPETWNIWTMKGDLTDFKTAYRVGTSEFDSLDQVGEDGQFRYGKISDRGEPIALGTYGKLFRITRQAIINDDLSVLTTTPAKMGRAASRTVGDVVYGLLLSNPVMNQDGLAVFQAGTHKNYVAAGGGAPPSIATLSAMRVAMALQKDQANNAHGLNIQAGYVLVPVALRDATTVVITSEFDNRPLAVVNAQIPNPIRNIGDVVADPRLDADSAVKWYGVAQKGFDTIEVAFLDGNENPTVEQRAGWEVDGSEFKVRLDIGAAFREWRTFYRNDGA